MAVWSAPPAPDVIDAPAAWGPISRTRVGRDRLLLPPEGFAEQQEGKQCREHGQREPAQRGRPRGRGGYAQGGAPRKGEGAPDRGRLPWIPPPLHRLAGSRAGDGL